MPKMACKYIRKIKREYILIFSCSCFLEKAVLDGFRLKSVDLAPNILPASGNEIAL